VWFFVRRSVLLAGDFGTPTHKVHFGEENIQLSDAAHRKPALNAF
jgi:hypothetical protein